jgi:hypothetical protein
MESFKKRKSQLMLMKGISLSILGHSAFTVDAETRGAPTEE